MKCDFGEYRSEVNEVIKFSRSGNVLIGGDLPKGIDAKVIDNIDEIPDEQYYYDFDDACRS